jgi:hypothetical protein
MIKPLAIGFAVAAVLFGAGPALADEQNPAPAAKQAHGAKAAPVSKPPEPAKEQKHREDTPNQSPSGERDQGAGAAADVAGLTGQVPPAAAQAPPAVAQKQAQTGWVDVPPQAAAVPAGVGTFLAETGLAGRAALAGVALLLLGWLVLLMRRTRRPLG